MRDFIQADDVAGMIGLDDGAAFLRRRARLERDEGFPKPLPTSLRPLIWHRCQVEGWLSAQTNPRPAGMPTMPTLRLIETAGTR